MALCKYWRGLTVLLICIYAMYLRLIHLMQHKLWQDEYYQLGPMQGTLLELIKALPKHEHTSYLSGDYFLIYPFFKIFAFNKWGLAIPHIIVTIVGLVFLYLICKRFFKTSLGYLITFSIVCFNAILILHATEIRTYAVLPTLALMALYFSNKVVDQNVKMSVKTKCAIGAFFVMVIWWHVYGVLIFFLPFAFEVMNKLMNKQDGESIPIILKDMFKFACIIICIAMPLWLYSVFGPHLAVKNADGTGIMGGNVFQFIPNPLENMVGFLKGVFGNLMGYNKLYFLLAGVIIAPFVPYKNRIQQTLFVMVTVLIPIGLILMMDIVSDYWFLQRQFCWVIPFFAIYIGWIWDSLFDFTLNIFKMRSN